MQIALAQEIVDVQNLDRVSPLTAGKLRDAAFDPVEALAVAPIRELVDETNLTTGVEALDRTLILRVRQLAILHGKISRSLSLLLCVRAVLPYPLGPDSDVIFIYGGNCFDAYTISERSIEHELDSEMVLERIHISRAFT